MSNKKKLSSKQILGFFSTSSFLFTSSSPGGVCRRGPWVDGNNNHNDHRGPSVDSDRGSSEAETSISQLLSLIRASWCSTLMVCLLVWGPGGPRDSKGTPFYIKPFHFWGDGIPGIQTTGTPNQQLTISWLVFNKKKHLQVQIFCGGSWTYRFFKNIDHAASMN